MKAFLCLSAVLAAASADLGLVHHGVAHHAAVHAPVLPTPVSGAIAPVNYGANRPVNGYGHGQVSHQSVANHTRENTEAQHRARLLVPMLLLLLMPPTDFSVLMLLSPMEFMPSMPQSLPTLPQLLLTVPSMLLQLLLMLPQLTMPQLLLMLPLLTMPQ